MIDLIMDICIERMEHDCWGCPFRSKIGRNTTCKDWVYSHMEEANKLAKLYIKNDRKDVNAFIGKLKDGVWQQRCANCESVIVIRERDLIFDNYVNEVQYVCPICHSAIKFDGVVSKKRKAV